MNLLTGIGVAMLAAAPQFGCRIRQTHRQLMQVHRELDRGSCFGAARALDRAKGTMLALEATGDGQATTMGALLVGYEEAANRFRVDCRRRVS